MSTMNFNIYRTMNFNVFVIFWISLIFYSCKNSRKCEDDEKRWINESPIVLKEFIEVKQEILSNKIFLNEFVQEGTLFLRPMDSDKYLNHEMPNLNNWFNMGRGYISFSETDTSFCFKSCEKGSYTMYATIEKLSNIEIKSYNESVIILDTMILENSWKAIVTECNGCVD
jgi:hypothetical protein